MLLSYMPVEIDSLKKKKSQREKSRYFRKETVQPNLRNSSHEEVIKNACVIFLFITTAFCYFSLSVMLCMRADSLYAGTYGNKRGHI